MFASCWRRFTPYGLVFTIRGGKVVRWRMYPDHQSALEAAGLIEQPGFGRERVRMELGTTLEPSPK